MDYRLRLPWLHSGAADIGVTGEGELCGMNGAAAHFAALWLGVLGERAKRMRCDARLVEIAQHHADYLIGRVGDELQQSMHYGRGGITPNQRVRDGGYHLPDWHGGGNTVESCVRSSPDAAGALDILLASPSHRLHLMGEGFWDASVVYGIGQTGTDWVVLICPPE